MNVVDLQPRVPMAAAAIIPWEVIGARVSSGGLDPTVTMVCSVNMDTTSSYLCMQIKSY